jgi:hypothetical protein
VRRGATGPGLVRDDPPQYGTRDIRCCHLTDEGRAHYVEYLAVYRDLYPDIDAPELPAAADRA